MRHLRRERKKRGLRAIFIFWYGIIFLGSSYFLVTLFFWQRENYISPLAEVARAAQVANTNKKTSDGVRSSLEKAHIPTISVAVSGNTATVILSTEEKILISTQKDLASQVSSLQRILSRFTIEGKRFKQIDLRFDRPIILLK